MSGALRAFALGLEAVTGLDTLAFGAMGGVVLGDFVFQGFEVPPFITFGTHQTMTEHRLPGGDRVFDLLGPDHRDLDWAGTFIDFDPERRAQTLDQMCADGIPLALVWGSFYYTVLIKDVSFDNRHQQFTYRISCAVIPTPPPDGGASDLTNSVNDDINTALAGLRAVEAAAVTSQEVVLSSKAVLGVQQTVGDLGDLSPDSSDTAARAALASANDAQAQLLASRTVAETSLAGAAGTTGGLVSGVAGLTTALTATADLAALTQAQGYVGRAVVNLGGAPWV